MFNEYGISEEDIRKGIVYLEQADNDLFTEDRFAAAEKPHAVGPVENLSRVKLCLIWEKDKFERISTGQTFPPKDIRYVFPRFPKGRFLPSIVTNYFNKAHVPTQRELSERDDEDNARYSYCLQIFDEPPLYDMQTNKEIFRLLTVPSFARPSLIRLEKDGSQCSLTWKICEQQVHCGIEKIIEQQTFEISNFLWNIFQAKLGRVGLWNPQAKNLWLDGTSFLFEGRTQGIYLMKYEHCPESKAFVDLCSFFRQLCGCKKYRWPD